jgi:hypothetical protein
MSTWAWPVISFVINSFKEYIMATRHLAEERCFFLLVEPDETTTPDWGSDPMEILQAKQEAAEVQERSADESNL